MNIDLLFTKQNEAGLISDENLIKKVVGALFDPQTGMMSLEYVDMDYLEFNIGIDEDFFGALDMCSQLHIGAVKGGNIAQAYQIPLMFLDDPYRGEALKQNVKQAQKPLQAFNAFIKSCVMGQPVHRDDLGNDESASCVLGDSIPSALQFAPHLARRHTMEVAPKAAPHNAPRFSAPGLGGGGGGGGYTTQNPSHRSMDDDEP